MLRFVLATLLTLGALPAQAIECRLALLLAMDVSSSVDEAEDALQRGGMVAALTAPEVTRAFFSSDLPVALAVFEWSGRYNQKVLLDWTLINNQSDLLFAAQTLATSARSQTEFPTAMGYALGYGAGMFKRAPPCLRQTLDMAGDGENNEGFPPSSAYKAFPFDAVTVNGLVINAADFEAETNLIPYYQNEVIRGPGAFIEVAQGFEDYERAMRRKLERELAMQAIGALYKHQTETSNSRFESPEKVPSTPLSVTRRQDRSIDVADLIGPISLDALQR
ncbi:MAG: DUF1194 domain-containing protein [Rhodobacteraceae bacterium]|jgi:hypothetical protein|nr:DUF1194 domain-containing protein [Paracoccaceae bacterium]